MPIQASLFRAINDIRATWLKRRGESARRLA